MHSTGSPRRTVPTSQAPAPFQAIVAAISIQFVTPRFTGNRPLVPFSTPWPPLLLRRIFDLGGTRRSSEGHPQTPGPPQADHSRGACPRGNGERESISVFGGPRFVVAVEPSCRVGRARRNPPALSLFNPLAPNLGGRMKNLGTPQTPAGSILHLLGPLHPSRTRCPPARPSPPLGPAADAPAA